MFDKEKFHNTLALSLGYERIVKDNRITIEVDESDDPWVTLRFLGCPEVLRLKASGNTDVALIDNNPAMKDEIRLIDKAYIESNKSLY